MMFDIKDKIVVHQNKTIFHYPKTSNLIIVSLAVFLSAFSSYTKTAVPVFLLSGQSNMVSMASVNDLTSDQNKTINTIMINISGDCDPNKKGKWLPLGPGFGSQAVNFGLELMLGKTLSDSLSGRKIAFIKNAVNGTALGRSGGWLPPRSNKGNGGMLYKNMMSHIDAALKSFNTAFDTTVYTPAWAGFIWLQGESDAMDNGLANSYAVNLENLIKDIREKTATPDLPVIFPMITTLTIWTYNSKIRSADIAMKGNFENIDTVETKQYQTPDGMHYNAVGQIKIGHITALRWLAMKYNFDHTVPVQNSNTTPMRLPTSSEAGYEFSLYDLSGRRLPTNNLSENTNTTPPSLFISTFKNSNNRLSQKKLNYNNKFSERTSF